MKSVVEKTLITDNGVLEFIYLFIYHFLRWRFTLVAQAGQQWPELSSLQPLLPGFKWFCCSASWVAEITGTCYHAQLIFVFLVETGFYHIGQAGPELLTSSVPSSLASQSAGITGKSHHVWPNLHFSKPYIIIIVMWPSILCFAFYRE